MTISDKDFFWTNRLITLLFSLGGSEDGVSVLRY
jgi:hypothetical protein